MKVAILSDIHDNVWNLRAALMATQEAGALVCCGDLCSPFIIGLLGEGFPQGPVHIVFGNNDGDLFRIAQVAGKYPHVRLHGEFFQDVLGGRRIAANHYDNIARAIAASGDYDVVCYGHNHVYRIEQAGSTLTINPGAIMGYHPVDGDIPATFVLYETETGAVERIEL